MSYALRELERGFRSKSSFQCFFEGCVGAVDGLIIKIRQPRYPSETLNPGRFFVARKHCFGLNLQAVCDSKYRFTFAEVCAPFFESERSTYRTLSGTLPGNVGRQPSFPAFRARADLSRFKLGHEMAGFLIATTFFSL